MSLSLQAVTANDRNTHISIPLGIFIGLLASFVQSLGLTIQRKSHVLDSQQPEGRRKADFRRRLWLLGFAIFISSNIIGALVQIASLPVVILAPLGAVSLLWNAVFARLILGDVFSLWMILGTLFIAGGAVLIAIFGIVPEPTRSLEDLLELWGRPVFVVYFSILGAIVIVCLVMTHIIECSLARKFATLSPESAAASSPTGATANPSRLTTGVSEEITITEQTPLLHLDRKKNATSVSPNEGSIRGHLESATFTRSRLFVAISYASFSGIISGMCLLFAKSGLELLLLTVGGHNQFWRWQSWMLLIALGVFALLQLWYLHKGLVLADPTLVCPSAFCFYNLSSIVNGLVYFDQFALISPSHLGLVVVGIVILLAGVWVVSIQAGGGGVDVDRWKGNDEPLSDEDDDMISIISEGSESGPQDVPEGFQTSDESQSLLVRGHEQQTFGPVRMERQSVSESHIPTPPQLLRIQPATVDEIRTLPMSITSPRSPSAYDRITSDASLLLSPSSARARRRRRSALQPPDAQHSLSPPLRSSSVLSGGLSIGLGPMSPGFSIVPLDSRRRISGLGFTVEEMRAQRRRTVSEGDVRRLAEGAGGSGGVGETGAQPGGSGEHTADANMKWNWVRKVFLGRT